jgi:alkanesulfonate monooxygenase SsuD/methylene tetrahydromethanopterin reductase-like flavin-dependent oxidoreductase (luciferase family)
VRIGVKPGQWGWSFDELRASWRAAEDAGFDILSCFDHVSAAPSGGPAWDAPTLLAAMAGATERIDLAVDVVNVALRHPFLLAGQLAVAQAASVLRALWCGGEVTEPSLGLEAASLGPIAIDPPPIVIGGSSNRAIDIAARHADGWNCVVGRDDLAGAGRRLDELAGRHIERIAQVFLRDVGFDGARETMRRIEHDGADAIVFVLVDERGPEAVRRLAHSL